MTRSIAPLLASLVLVLAACGGSDKPKPAASEVTATATAVADANRCEPAQWSGPNDATFDKPSGELDPATTYVAAVETNCGTFEITLDVARAPKTSASFKSLADQKLYDGTGIHRIVPGFVIQGGDPKGDGTGGPGYKVVEAPPKDLVYDVGVVAMAKEGNEAAGTSGSQFFVVTGPDAAKLPPDYALLGKITSGDNIVEKIGEIITDPNTDRPDAPVVIKSIRVTEK